MLGTLAAILLTGAGVWWLVATGSLLPVLGGLRSVDPRILAWVLPLVVVIQFARAARFILLLGERQSGSLLTMFRISCLHIVLNFLLPFKLGEAAFPLLARRVQGVDLAAGTSTLLTARGLDVGTLFAMLAIAAAWAVPALAPWRFLALPAAALALLAPLVLLVAARLGQRRIRALQSVGDVLERAKGRRVFGQATLLSLLIWTCHAAVAWLAFRALDVPAGLATAVFAGVAANLAFALPFQGIAGLGPVQAAFAWAATVGGVPLERAIVVAIACHAALLASACVLGLLALASEPKLRWWRIPDARLAGS